MGNFINYYFSYSANGHVTSAMGKANSTNQQVKLSQSVFFGPSLDAVLVHTLKNPSEMLTLHKQLMHNLRPTIPAPLVHYHNKKQPLAMKKMRQRDESQAIKFFDESQAIKFFDGSCVNNPLVQSHSTGTHLPECKPSRHAVM